MSDLRLAWSGRAADLVVAENDLVPDDGLEAAVLRSLLTNRRATPDDVIPDGSADRQGWWGDAFTATSGDQGGSRLWLLTREKQVPAVLDRARAYATEALQWLLDDGIAAAVDVQASFVRIGVVGLLVTITRPLQAPVFYRFDYAWAAQAERVS